MRVKMNSKTFLFVVFVLASLIIADGQTVYAKNQSAQDVQTFVTYKYVDPMTGMEAFHLLIPKGWKAQGSIQWLANPALPAQSHFRFYNPSGSGEFNLFPTRSYFWTDNRTFLASNPPGSLRFHQRLGFAIYRQDEMYNYLKWRPVPTF